MKSASSKILIALALFCGPVLPAPEAGEEDGDCRDAAAKIARFAEANDINKISLLGFESRGGAEKNEADYVSERIGAYLAGYKKPALIERTLLEKVLKEARLSSAADGDKAQALRDIFSIDAVVTGTVFACGEKLKILTRLIDVKTGRVLMAAQSESERERAQLSEVPDIDPDWGRAAWAPAPADLRDAVSDSGADSCSGRKLRLARLNLELVDTKALYWAAKMKEPGFSLRNLTRNPGTEITDPEVKAMFYRLLGAYYRSGNAPGPEPDKMPLLQDLLDEEARVHNECGYR